MADYYMSLTTGRMEISGGKIREVSDPVEEVKQRAIIAIKTHRGEWLFDTDHGLPWTESILVKGVNVNQVASRIRAYLLTVQGVDGVPALSVSLNSSTRALTITLTLEILGTVTAPFNVTVVA
jgi:hypothetical protein